MLDLFLSLFFFYSLLVKSLVEHHLLKNWVARHLFLDHSVSSLSICLSDLLIFILRDFWLTCLEICFLLESPCHLFIIMDLASS
jgi:hypothetical protein